MLFSLLLTASALFARDVKVADASKLRLLLGVCAVKESVSLQKLVCTRVGVGTTAQCQFRCGGEEHNLTDEQALALFAAAKIEAKVLKFKAQSVTCAKSGPCRLVGVQ